MRDEAVMIFEKRMKNIGDRISFAEFCDECASWLNSRGDSDSAASIAELSGLPARFVSETEEKAELEKRKRLIIQILNHAADSACQSEQVTKLETLLEQFFGFLRLLNRPAHKKSKYAVHSVVPENEYDLQHLLYAFLRPMYPNLRAEHTLDDGYLAVRADFSVTDKTVIETKFTRAGLTEAKLAEEIAADILRYPAESVIFLIADPVHIITDPVQFSMNYEKRAYGKNVRILILD